MTSSAGSLCKAIGLHPLQLERATPSDAPMMFRRARHENLRHKTLKEHREKAVMERLARVSPERLDELIRGGEYPTRYLATKKTKKLR